ncbi:response regulator [Halomonas campisalis]|uniref:Response regulator n=1 Tax=Billgrantia campisalis TaxID=74661 RepID=A0ABS9P7A5_9GAMM|nr:response regulator [Halomonas campisalis]MCG6657664.1 response regulator [Halomonas campisalis]MDR5862564.1 response regulator [Halomonas campisalis]
MNDSTQEVATPLILLAEDHAELRGDIRDELHEAGYAVIEAVDGEEAVAQIHAVAPDLILCDINMPGRNGYEVLREIRDTRPDLADMPFVFLTALSDTRDIIDGKRLGADDYLVKPIDFDLMLATLEARLRQVRRMRHKASREIDELRQAMTDLRQEASSQAFSAATRALDLVAPGMVLLGPDGQLLYANRAARQLASDTEGLEVTHGLSIASGADSQALRRTLRATLTASAAGREAVNCLRLARPGKQRALLVLACSLGNAGGLAREPAAVILLADPDKRARVPQTVLASLFGLTPTEARIALALAEGLRSDEIAEQMSVSTTTIAFHLRNLFQKTDTHRQAELIALVLSGSMSVALD